MDPYKQKASYSETDWHPLASRKGLVLDGVVKGTAIGALSSLFGAMVGELPPFIKALGIMAAF